MVAPNVLRMEKLHNTFRDGVFSFIPITEAPFNETDIIISTDTETDFGVIHKEDFKKVLFQFKNLGSNSITLTFYGAAINDIENGTDNPVSPPPDFSTGDYFALPTGVTIIDGNETDARIATDNWTWILIRAKSTNAGQATTAQVIIRGK